jgi:hypothetical protein
VLSYMANSKIYYDCNYWFMSSIRNIRLGWKCVLRQTVEFCGLGLKKFYMIGLSCARKVSHLGWYSQSFPSCAVPYPGSHHTSSNYPFWSSLPVTAAAVFKPSNGGLRADCAATALLLLAVLFVMEQCISHRANYSI